MIQIYHNSRCGKSRDCLLFITETGKKFEVIKYLEDIPTFDELTNIIKKLDIKPIDLIRKKEKIWIENFKNLQMTDTEIINAMISNPILIERPILIKRTRAIVGRPIESVIKFLK